jgi:hypothetical protein
MSAVRPFNVLSVAFLVSDRLANNKEGKHTVDENCIVAHDCGCKSSLTNFKVMC